MKVDREKTFIKTTRIISTVVLVMMIIAVSVLIGSAESYHTIRINYYYVDGTPAHDPYIATYPAGDPVDITVTNPKIYGFDPMTEAEGGLSAEKTTFSYDKLNSNVTRNVYYVAGLTHYAARYYKQNIYDDLYTLDSELTEANKNLYGRTGESPTTLEKVRIEGFTNLFHEPDAIAADGSTVFRVYYDRNYYSVNFDLGEGGYGVDPIYAKYQTVFRIEDPKRLGYSFKGWTRTDADSTRGVYGTDWHYIDADGSVIDEDAATADENLIRLEGDQRVPAKNTYYKAVWEPGTTSFSVVYWIENANDDNYTVIATKQFDKYANGNSIIPGQTITPETEVKNAAGNTIHIKDFFSYNLRYADPDNVANKTADHDDPHYDVKGKVIDFNDISKGTSTDLFGHSKYFEMNTSDNTENPEFVTETSKTVAGDGTTRYNVFFKRIPFTLKFFYAKTDREGKVYLVGRSSPYSKSTSGTLQGRLQAPDWDNCVTMADGVPQIVPQYADRLTAETVTLGNDTYYYYSAKMKYGSDLRKVWLLDAFESRQKKKKDSDPEKTINETVRFGGWAVQNGTVYESTHNNKTVKGIYEKLDDQMVFSNKNRSDFFEISFVGFWTNASYSQSWNNSQSNVYNFTYQNYVELLPKEVEVVEVEGTSALTTGENPVYLDVRRFTSDTTPKWYGLTRENHIETYDAGDQYGKDVKNGTYATKDVAIRINQTAVELTGFELEYYRLYDPNTQYSDEDLDPDLHKNSNCLKTNQLILDRHNTEIEWDSNNDHHATIKFYYSRHMYTLTYHNGNRKENDFTKSVPYQAPLNSKITSGENADQYRYYYENPDYYIEALRGYYTFDGWYDDPRHEYRIDVDSFTMAADDAVFYANWVPKTIDVIFYNDYNDYYMDRDRMVLGKDSDDQDITALSTEYGTTIPLKYIPVDDDSEENPRPKLKPIAKGASFAGWYYIRNRLPVRFEPENVPVTALNEESTGDNGKLRLFAEWVTKDVAKYQIRYVEKDNPEKEIAAPTVGRAFVWKTKTFNAKSANELYDDYKWTSEGTESGKNWWPTANSHSIVVRSNEQGEEFKPNTYTFTYIQKKSVHYKVQYLDAATRYPINPEQGDIEKESTRASVKEDAQIIPGYVARSASQTLVLTASVKSGEEARSEELENNVVTFLYDKNDTEYLYEVEYYTKDLSSDSYSLYHNETLTVNIADEGDTVVTVADLYSRSIPMLLTENGFTRVPNATTYTKTDASGTSEPESVADNGTVKLIASDKRTIRIYFDRKSYSYSYRYIDHTQEKIYHDKLANNESVEGVWDGVIAEFPNAGTGVTDEEIVISPDEKYTYTDPSTSVKTDYVRISASEVSLTVQPDENNQDVNLVKIYYRKDIERELQYKMVCVNAGTIGYEHDSDPVTEDPLFGRLTFNMQTVQSYDDIQDIRFIETNDEIAEVVGDKVTYLHDHHYTFLGWYSTPTYDPEHPEVGRLTAPEVKTLTKELLNTDGKLPEKDTTYYALVSQDMVKANVEFRYLDDYITASFRALSDADATTAVAGAATDADGAHVGAKVVYNTPSQYVNNSPVAWHRSDGYALQLDPIDGRVYKYEFAEWWEMEDDNQGNLIRKTNWNSSDEWYATSLKDVISRTKDQHLIAVYTRRAVEEMPYTVNYTFTTRTQGVKTFVVSGVLKADQLNGDNVQVTESGCFELTDSFILTHAPYESNHGERLVWSADPEYVRKDSIRGDGKASVDRIVTDVTAIQTKQEVVANYRTVPEGGYTAISGTIGDNYEMNEEMLKIKAEDEYNGLGFSHWEVRKSESDSAPVVAKSYDTLFDLCLLGNYWISPVYGGSGDKIVVLNASALAEGNEDWLAWTWSEGQGGELVRPTNGLTFRNLGDKVVFIRIAKGQVPDAEWKNVWNKTDDLDVTDNGTFTLNAWRENTNIMEGTWSEGMSSAPTVVLTHLDYSRNHWTDPEIPEASGGTDLLYTDFEIAFEDGTGRIGVSDEYQAGVVFELCGKLDGDFDPEKDYGYKSDPAMLKNAVKAAVNAGKASGKYNYDPSDTALKRSIQLTNIPVSGLTIRDRVNFAKSYKNAYKVAEGTGAITYTNANYLMKVTAYLKKGDEVTLSNSMYISLKDVAFKDNVLTCDPLATSAAAGE